MTDTATKANPHDAGQTITDDAALLAHVSRLFFEREPLSADCPLCVEIAKRLLGRWTLHVPPVAMPP